MDLLTVLQHELGHLLGEEHRVGGLMRETLAPGKRVAPSSVDRSFGVVHLPLVEEPLVGKKHRRHHP